MSRHPKDERIRWGGEIQLWALARDLKAILDEPRHSEQFVHQEVGRTIREAYIAGMNVESKLASARALRHFDESMAELNERFARSSAAQDPAATHKEE